ncbi:MAG: PilZ domain-containing protein [Pseudomonadota bacterium]
MPDSLSVTTYVMSAELPWPDDSPAADALGALDPASLHHKAGQPRACSIRKISALGATLRGAGLKADGEPVAVELDTGQRAGGTVDWADCGEAGVRFDRPIDMISLLNRKLVSQPGERRTMPRVELRCPVGIKWGINLAAGNLRNISARGLQVEGDGLPPRDTLVSLFIDGLNVRSGEVVWQKGRLAGIEFLDELSWSSIMPWIRDNLRRQGN